MTQPKNKVAPTPITTPITDVLENDFKKTVLTTKDDWVKGTSLGALKTRSDELKALDNALDTYHKQHESVAALGDLRRAFDTWISKTPNSERNPTLLHDLLAQISSARAYADQQAVVNRANNPESNAALMAYKTLEQLAIKRMFLDPQWAKDNAAKPNPASEPKYRNVVPKTVSAESKKQVADLAALKKVAKSLKKTIQKPDMDPTDTFKTGFGKLCEGVDPAELFSDDAAAKTFFDAAGTVLGAVMEPAKLIAAIGSAVMDAYNASTIKDSRSAFKFDPDAGPSAAFDGLIALMDRDAQNKKVDIATVAAKVAALAVPVAGAVLGASIDALVGIAMRARMLSVERQEMAQAQTLLNQGKVDGNLFQECPLLGCYFLCLADTSVLLNWSHEDIYSDSFRANIETLRQQAQPAIEKARAYIRSANYVLEGTEGLKGLAWEPALKKNTTEYLSKLFSATSFLKTMSGLFNKSDNLPTQKEIVDAYHPLLTYDAASLANLARAKLPGDSDAGSQSVILSGTNMPGGGTHIYTPPPEVQPNPPPTPPTSGSGDGNGGGGMSAGPDQHGEPGEPDPNRVIEPTHIDSSSIDLGHPGHVDGQAKNKELR